ncbi:MAG: glycosyltransferase family 4 protein [Candidatus Nanohaloarchaea archaeon]
MAPKVLLVGWSYPPEIEGGLDIHIKHLFEELLELGVEVDLLLPEQNAPDKERVIGADVGDGDMVQKARRLSEQAAKIAERYDAVHTHDWLGAEAGFKAKKYSDVSWVSTFHSLSSGRTRNPSGRLERFEEAAATADRVIAVSEKLAEEVEQEFGRKPDVIYNGFSKPESSGVNPKQRHGIEDDMIFYVGRHAEQKGVEHLLYGFKKFLETGDATLVLGGDGHMRDALEDFAEKLGIENSVVFTGFIPREELGDYYNAADVFVSPSINEPFGLTITEAVESGTPVVATSSGAEELLGDAIFSAEPDSDSLASAITDAMESEEVEVDSRGWHEMAEETLEVYRDVKQG